MPTFGRFMGRRVTGGMVRAGQTLAVLMLPLLHAWPTSARSVIGQAGFGLELDLELDPVPS